ncbi:ABC transporter permease [Xanthomonas phaseoli pv. dieffenbachiae]|uniref:ABC transporter permease n=1 Tax=Xanthomonas TaxID=338 RepID=UPI0006E4F71D|nr:MULTISPECIES: ABC transporter permease [Xanthomonas]MBO9749306.1 ABC transporter permease [Xanthomonas phaseoli pv. dieffenbachiae]MBO9750574.1 ABC transporter permease [Xanthomonas phaseoli pv. dieffenbachiae]MBO9891257.1 ABC transporter permease [Xanthomonas sp. D-36-1]
MKDMLRALWAYRYFIFSSIKNELRIRFVQSRLGGLWMIIHPLMQVLIFALILSEVLSAKLPGIDNKYAYALYLMAGTLGWNLFAETIGKCVSLFIDSGNLMKKMAFPRICLPFIAAGTTLMTNLLLLVAIFVVFAALGHFPDHHLIWLPALILTTLLLSLGVGLILGVLNVFMRDIGQVVPVVLQALFWLTPIVYNINILPDAVQRWFKYNPLYPLVTSYQNVLVYGKPPLWGDIFELVLVSLVLLVVALVMFRRAGPEMVDSL